MEKRLPIALVLSLLFLLWYTAQYQLPAPEGEGGGDPAAVANDPASDPRSPGGPSGGSTGGPTGGAGRSDPGYGRDDPPSAPVSDAPARTVDIETADSHTTWQSMGASVIALDLKEFQVSPEDDSLLPLIGEVDGKSGSFLLRDLNDRYGLDRLNWELEEGTHADGLPQLVFRHTTQDGLQFTRTVSYLDPVTQPHTFSMRISVTNTTDRQTDALDLVLESARGLVDEEAGSAFYGAPTALAIVKRTDHDPELITWSGGDLTGDSRRIGDDEHLVAAGTMTNYFASMLTPADDVVVRQVYPLAVPDQLKLERRVAEKAPMNEREADRWRMELRDDVPAAAGAELQLWVPRLGAKETLHFDFDVYNGPQDLDTAALPGYGFLGSVIESAYGNWAIINKTLLQILRFFHGIFGNWGVAIILLTLLVKTILFPLNRKQQTSMAKYGAVMAKLKQQLDELKKKYKKNMKKYNEEQMKLLKAEGASPPLGGCLLMFLQFPIWISLFQILGTSIELRQSHFVFWINDLSRPDAMPFGIAGMATLNLLPVLMAIATTVQMRFATPPADPQQAQTQKIMGLIMPIFMLFFLYGYSSGLSLYIFTSALIGIFEFQVIRRIWPVPGVPAHPAKA